MQASLSPELYWAILSAIFTSALWMPHILRRVLEMGPYAAFRDPRHDVPTHAPWAQRAIRAHSNAVENLAVFGLLALSVQILGVSDRLTAYAAALYFASRVAHYLTYVLGIPWLRTPMFLAGFACQLILAARLLRLV